MSEESRNRDARKPLRGAWAKSWMSRHRRAGRTLPGRGINRRLPRAELGQEETAACEMHFAACSRCRKILTVLAASDDAPLAEKEVARLENLSPRLTCHMRLPLRCRVKRHLRAKRSLFGNAQIGACAGWPQRLASLRCWPCGRDAASLARDGARLIGNPGCAGPKNEQLLPPEPAPSDQLSQAAPAKKLGTDSATSFTNTPQSPVINPRPDWKCLRHSQALAREQPW